MKNGLVESVAITDVAAATTHTFTEVGDEIQVAESGPTVGLASGNQRRRGYKKDVTLPILNAGAFATLRPIFEARKIVNITINYKGGDADVFAGARGLVTPIVAVVPDQANFHIADAGTSDADLTAIGWEDLKYAIGTSQPEFTAEAPNTDGNERPLFGFARLNHEVELPEASYSALKTRMDAGTSSDVVISLPDGTKRKYTGVQVEVHYMPNPGPNSERTVVARFFETANSFSSLISLPVGANNYQQGAMVTATAFGYEEADVVTAAAVGPA